MRPRHRHPIHRRARPRQAESGSQPLRSSDPRAVHRRPRNPSYVARLSRLTVGGRQQLRLPPADVGGVVAGPCRRWCLRRDAVWQTLLFVVEKERSVRASAWLLLVVKACVSSRADDVPALGEEESPGHFAASPPLMTTQARTSSSHTWSAPAYCSSTSGAATVGADGASRRSEQSALAGSSKHGLILA
jgi:hypothetical protein